MKRILNFSVLLIVLAFVPACGMIINNEKFDSEKWKKGDARIKGKMVYDLQNSKVLIGKNQNEVDEILGKTKNPSKTGRVYEIDTNVITDIYFTVHFNETTQKVVSTDIGD